MVEGIFTVVEFECYNSSRIALEKYSTRKKEKLYISTIQHRIFLNEITDCQKVRKYSSSIFS